MIYKQNHVRQNEFKSEKPIPKYYFTVREVSEIIGEVQSVIRFWTNEFNIYRKCMTFKKKWMYPRNSVARLHHIKRLLREEKYTIEGSKLKLKLINIEGFRDIHNYLPNK